MDLKQRLNIVEANLKEIGFEIVSIVNKKERIHEMEIKHELLSETLFIGDKHRIPAGVQKSKAIKMVEDLMYRIGYLDTNTIKGEIENGVVYEFLSSHKDNGIKFKIKEEEYGRNTLYLIPDISKNIKIHFTTGTEDKIFYRFPYNKTRKEHSLFGSVLVIGEMVMSEYKNEFVEFLGKDLKTNTYKSKLIEAAKDYNSVHTLIYLKKGITKAEKIDMSDVAMRHFEKELISLIDGQKGDEE